MRSLPFGGIFVVLGGDLRQLIIPVIEGGVRSSTIDDAITNSPLWKSVLVLDLTMNTRFVACGLDSVEKEELSKFSDWILSMGDVTLSIVSRAAVDDGTWIQIPNEMLILLLPVTEYEP
jgi:hypothetical protein